MIDTQDTAADAGAPAPAGELSALIEAANSAPSMRDTRPWRLSVGPDRVDVFAEMDRWLPVTDDDQRALHLSLGCVLENLVIAAEQQRRPCEVTLLPEPERPDWIATLRIGPVGDAPPTRDPVLFGAIPIRHTNRQTYSARPVAPDVLDRLRACVSEDDITLHAIADRGIIDHVAGLVERGDREELADPSYRRELAAWIARGAFDTPRLLRPIARLAAIHLDTGEGTARRDRERLDSAGAILVVVSLTDDTRSRVRAGQVLQRVWLLATHLGLAAQPMSQPLEIPRLRRQLGTAIGVAHTCPQHLFRIGYVD